MPIAALRPDDTVIGGGHVAKLQAAPPHCRPMLDMWGIRSSAEDAWLSSVTETLRT